MSNPYVQALVDECDNDFVRIERIIDVLTNTNPAVPYLTKYVIIKACGTLEQAFKIIISDFKALLGISGFISNYLIFGSVLQYFRLKNKMPEAPTWEKLAE